MELGIVPGRRRVDQLKMLAAIREILHNDDACVPFFGPFCTQFEKILNGVALQTSLYNVESCIILCDLVEEFLSSLILSDSHTKHRVLIQKDNVIDWNFWILVTQRMLSSQNVCTILRAMAFLFNVWDNIPISIDNGAARSSCDRPRNANNAPMFDLFDDQEGLRWNCTLWLLSPQMWKVYFCHWHPLVRSCYLRLVCWRVASVGTESGLLSSVLFSNYNHDARLLLSQRLSYTFGRFKQLNDRAIDDKRPITSAISCSPALNRSLKIVFNPASSQPSPMQSLTYSDGSFTPAEGTIAPSSSSTPTRRIDPYEVFDDVAYSFPTVPLPSDLLPNTRAESVVLKPTLTRKVASTSAIESLGNMIKKKWTNLRKGKSSGNLRQKLSLPKLHSKRDTLYAVSEYPPSLTSASTMSSSSHVRTPASGSSLSNVNSPASSPSAQSEAQFHDTKPSTPPEEQPRSPTSLTMSLIPPPPQILRKRPEIMRPFFKFSLEYTEPLSWEDAIAKGKREACSTTRGFVTTPHLPFSSENDLRASATGSDGESTEDSDEDRDTSGVAEFELAHVAPQERTKQRGLDDTKHWKYGGRSINEWDAIVNEFQDFISKRRQDHGAVRLEDVTYPFMIAEIPTKALLV